MFLLRPEWISLSSTIKIALFLYTILCLPAIHLSYNSIYRTLNNTILFEETQGATRKSVIDFLKILTGILLAAFVFNLFYQKGKFTDISGVLCTGFILSTLGILVTRTKMVTQIRNDGIYVRFPPFQPGFEKFLWKDIRHVYVRRYNAVSEYMGWGIKTGPMGKGYTVSGDMGIQIVLRNNYKVLIGTQQSEKVDGILKSLKQNG
jgi:hypothetical protein